MSDWRDRIVDAGLHELHGAPPPDLSARVLLALREMGTPEMGTPEMGTPEMGTPEMGTPEMGTPEMVTSPSPRGSSPHVASRGEITPEAPAAVAAARTRSLSLGFTTLAAAALLLGMTIGFALARGSSPRDPFARFTVLVDVHVRDGAIDVAAAPAVDMAVASATHARGAGFDFPARAGNRLHSDAGCELAFGPFGALALGPSTTLEVRTMDLTWKHGAVAASSLTLAVVAGVVTWHTLTRTETVTAGETLRLPAASSDDSAAAIAAENERLRQRLQQLEKQSEQLTTQAMRDRAPEVVEPPPPPPPDDAPAAPVTAPVFVDEQFADVLRSVDWQTVGAATHEMGPLLAELVAAMGKDGAEIPMDLAIKIGQLNMKLVEQLPAMLKAGLPGFGPNGTYTHPLVVANSLASTLDAAGQSLSPAQRAQIEGVARSFARENSFVATAQHEFELEHLMAEVDLKDRYFGELRTMLGPEQQAAIFPPGAGKYDGSGLFSAGLMLQGIGNGVPARDAAEFASAAGERIQKHLGLDADTAAKVQAIIERSTGSASELWQHRAEATELSALPMLKAGRTQAALRQQIRWMRELQRQVPLTPAQQKKLASLKGVFVPLPR
jgi:hypothetical protein